LGWLSVSDDPAFGVAMGVKLSVLMSCKQRVLEQRMQLDNVLPHTFSDLMCPHIFSPSPYEPRSNRNSNIASLLYSFPRASDTIGSTSGFYGKNVHGKHSGGRQGRQKEHLGERTEEPLRASLVCFVGLFRLGLATNEIAAIGNTPSIISHGSKRIMCRGKD
jgi:hypothetical protein